MLYLIPTHLGNPDAQLLPEQIKNVLEECEVLFAENLKTARHFLKAIGVEKKIDDFVAKYTHAVTLQFPGQKVDKIHGKLVQLDEEINIIE